MSSRQLTTSTFVVGIIAIFIAFSKLAIGLDMVTLNLKFVPWLALILIGYMLAVQFIKKIYIKRYGEWI